MEYTIDFSRKASVYPTTKVGLTGHAQQDWKPLGRWDTSREMTLVPRRVVHGIGAERAERPDGFTTTHVILEGKKRKLEFAKLWYELRDRNGYAIIWQGVVAVYDDFVDDSKELRDTIFLGLHECIEFVDPRIRMLDRVVQVDLDVGGRFPGKAVK